MRYKSPDLFNSQCSILILCKLGTLIDLKLKIRSFCLETTSQFVLNICSRNPTTTKIISGGVLAILLVCLAGMHEKYVGGCVGSSAHEEAVRARGLFHS